MRNIETNDGQITRRGFLRNPRSWVENPDSSEKYNVPVVSVQPIFAKRDEASKGDFIKEWERGFVRPISPWPTYLEKEWTGTNVFTIEDLFSGISNLQDIIYAIPLTPSQLIKENDNKPVYAVSTDSHADHIKDLDMGLAMLKFYASLAFDWDDPERQEIKKRIEGRVRENIPETLVQYAVFGALAYMTRDIRNAAVGTMVVKRAQQSRGVVHEYLLSQLTKYVSPDALDEISSMTKPFFASTKDIELQHSLMVRNLSHAYEFLTDHEREVSEPAVALLTLDNSAGNSGVWNDPAKQLRMIRKSVFDMLRLFKYECAQNRTEITPQRLLQVSTQLHELLGGVEIWEIDPELSDPRFEKVVSTKTMKRTIRPLQRGLNPLMRDIIKNKMKDVFPEQFDRIHFSEYNQGI